MHCYTYSFISHESLLLRVALRSLYVYSNMIIMVVDYYSSLIYECQVYIYSELSTYVLICVCVSVYTPPERNNNQWHDIV